MNQVKRHLLSSVTVLRQPNARKLLAVRVFGQAGDGDLLQGEDQRNMPCREQDESIVPAGFGQGSLADDGRGVEFDMCVHFLKLHGD